MSNTTQAQMGRALVIFVVVIIAGYFLLFNTQTIVAGERYVDPNSNICWTVGPKYSGGSTVPLYRRGESPDLASFNARPKSLVQKWHRHTGFCW